MILSGRNHRFRRRRRIGGRHRRVHADIQLRAQKAGQERLRLRLRLLFVQIGVSLEREKAGRQT